jgi:hypothetical protein
VHVIPRWKGDVADPRGGIRWILDEEAESEPGPCYYMGRDMRTSHAGLQITEGGFRLRHAKQ